MRNLLLILALVMGGAASAQAGEGAWCDPVEAAYQFGGCFDGSCECKAVAKGCRATVDAAYKCAVAKAVTRAAVEKAECGDSKECQTEVKNDLRDDLADLKEARSEGREVCLDAKADCEDNCAD